MNGLSPNLRTFEESPSEFAARIGIRLSTFSRKLRLSTCPQNFLSIDGRSGRIVRLRASPELEKFMREPQPREDE